MTKQTLLAAVYNPIDVDGRVKRTCAALAAEYDVTLLCLHGAGTFQSNQFRIVRVTTNPKRGRTWRLLGFWWGLVRLSLALKPDVVYANDFFLPFPGWLAARLSRACFVYDAHELIVPTDGRSTSRSEAIFYRLEKLVASRADVIITANSERAQVMQEHYGLVRQPVAVRNIAPPPISNTDDATIIARYGGLRRRQLNDVHVLYMGDMNFGRGIGILFDVARLLPERFQFIFVGNGPDLQAARARAAEKSERLRVIGPVAHSEVFDVVRQADIGFISYSMRSINEILCAPNKVIEYAQAGLPMVATCQPPIRTLFAAYRIGRVVGCNGMRASAEEVAKAINAVADAHNEHTRALPDFLRAHRWESEAAALLRAVTAGCRHTIAGS
jgi:glycosyltransferase involved in cell wall biosynthesis